MVCRPWLCCRGGACPSWEAMNSARAPPCLLRSCAIFQDPVSKLRIAAAWDVLELASVFVQPWGHTFAGEHGTPAPAACLLVAQHPMKHVPPSALLCRPAP